MGSNSKIRVNGGSHLHTLPTSFVAFDLETTGLDCKLCDIIEVGAVKVADGSVIDSFSSLANVGYELDPFITNLTGISNKMLVDAPTIDNVINRFSNFAGESILLAHNASFDMNFMYIAYERILAKTLTNDYIDTLSIAKRAFPEMKHKRLQDLCGALGVENGCEHRALTDVLATVECYKRMRSIVIKNTGMNQVTQNRFLATEMRIELR